MNAHHQYSSHSTDSNAAAQRRIRHHRTRVRKRELDRTLTELDLTPRQTAALIVFSQRLVCRLTAAPMQTLDHSEDQTLGQSALNLFGSEHESA